MFHKLQRKLLFPAGSRIPACRAWTAVRDVERWWIETDEGPVEAWWLFAGGGSGQVTRRPAMIFAHGNGELIDDWGRPMESVRDLGMHVLLTEYRGYGRSEGTPSEESVTRDLVQLHDRLVARDDVDPAKVVFMGRSLGGGAVCQLLRHRQAAALVLCSTFTDVPSLARRHLRLPGLLSQFVVDRFDSAAVLRGRTLPTFITHGKNDTLVPFEHALRLQELTGARLREEPGGHNDCPMDWRAWVVALECFLRDAGVLGT